MTRLPYAYARRHGLLLLAQQDGAASVLVREGVSAASLAELRRHLGCPLTLQHADAASFEAHLSSAYGEGGDSAASLAQDLGNEVDLARLMQDLPPVADLAEAQDDAPVIRLVNALLQQAVRERASDVHIEPYERESLVRLRRDGTLFDVARPHRGLHAALVSRIKVMASLDIAEKRLPQDGRIGLRLAGRAVDLRVSTVPTAFGERVVLRLLDKSAERFALERVGMATDTLAGFDALLGLPHGIVLVTGPTGAGKTTSLYAALRRIDPASRNIVTVEDPVEYELPGVGQVQVNPRIELTFARALRALLRQDPDVILIGEIRDLETAQIAVQASLTGHLVLATLHTNDAVSALTRLIDMGVEPFLLASTLRGVMAQRLLRTLCPACRTPHPAGEAERTLFGPTTPALLYAAAGCPACDGSGYRGRTGVFELLQVDAEFARLVHNGAPEAALRQHARHQGLRSLREDGLRHLQTGLTSAQELLRVTRD